MKKIFTLIAAMLLSTNLFAAEEVTLLELKTYSIAGAWGGTWSGTEIEKEKDWSSHEYIWFKYSGLAGGIQFGVTYSEWVADHGSWVEFKGASVACVDAAGVVGIKLDNTTKYVVGNAETDGNYKGDVYAKHVREIYVQATKDNSEVTLEGVWVGTEKEFLAATGYNADANHALQVSNGEAGTNAWDRQAICTLNASMEVDKTYVIEATILSEGGACQLVPVFSTSTNKDQWNNSADVEYLDNQTLTASTPTKVSWKFTAKFPHDKLQFFIGTIGGDLFFDNVSCKEEGSTTEMVNNGDFESSDISNWAVLSYAGQTMKLVEKDFGGTAGINTLKTVKQQSTRYNLSGQQVDENYKGVIIENGQKRLNK